MIRFMFPYIHNLLVKHNYMKKKILVLVEPTFKEIRKP